MLSAGMLTSLADSMAAFSRMLPFGSPPPFLAATVISRRILLKSLPRWTSALPFLRLICDHRECPDIAVILFRSRVRPSAASPAPGAARGEPARPAAPPLALGARREGPARLRSQVTAEMHVGQVRGAGVADLATPRLLGQDLDADLQR